MKKLAARDFEDLLQVYKPIISILASVNCKSVCAAMFYKVV